MPVPTFMPNAENVIPVLDSDGFTHTCLSAGFAIGNQNTRTEATCTNS
jgi:hypothetical protein